MAEVKAGKTDPKVANTVAYLATVLLRAHEADAAASADTPAQPYVPLIYRSLMRDGRKHEPDDVIDLETGERVALFMLQTHLNDLARLLSAGRVMHARFYMKAIFEEAIDQGFVERNPARKLILPKQLRPVDKTTLSWNQLRLVLASAALRDRILLTLDMTETFRPSELFALRWSGFDMTCRTLTVSQTTYRGKLRNYGKTKKSLRTVHLPEGLANELWLWKQECPDPSPDAFIFPNTRKRKGAMKNGFIRTDNYRARVLKKLAKELGLRKLNFQVLRRTIATLAQTKGSVKDVQGVLGHSKPDITANVYMQQIESGVRQTLEAIYSELVAKPGVAAVA